MSEEYTITKARTTPSPAPRSEHDDPKKAKLVEEMIAEAEKADRAKHGPRCIGFVCTCGVKTPKGSK